MPAVHRSARRSGVPPGGDHARRPAAAPKGSRHVRAGSACRPRPSAARHLDAAHDGVAGGATTRGAWACATRGTGGGPRWRIAGCGPGERPALCPSRTVIRSQDPYFRFTPRTPIRNSYPLIGIPGPAARRIRSYARTSACVRQRGLVCQRLPRKRLLKINKSRAAEPVIFTKRRQLHRPWAGRIYSEPPRQRRVVSSWLRGRPFSARVPDHGACAGNTVSPYARAPLRAWQRIAMSAQQQKRNSVADWRP